MSELPMVKYTGKIREIKIGKPGCEVVVGGETTYNFYSFEGNNPNLPKLALQVTDIPPEEWASAVIEPFKDVLDNPVAWARKCVDEYGADIVVLWLMGTDPNGKDLSPEHAAQTAKDVAEAINVPLIVWGVSSDDKNRETLKAVCESCDGMNVAVGPITENNYKQIGAAAMAYKHVVIANSPIDINLAKQLNILLETLGMPEDRIIIDPTTSGVGYGMEYCYSIMERIRQAALCQNDEKLQYPILNNIAEEVWKTKEAKLSEEEEPKLGDAAIRGVNLEAITATSVLQAGSNILVLRHPKTLEHIRKYISEIIIETDLESMNVDLSLTAEAPASPAPAPKPAAPAKPAPPPKEAAAPKPADKPTSKPAEKPAKAPKLEVAKADRKELAPTKPEPEVKEPFPEEIEEVSSTIPGIKESPVSIEKEEVTTVHGLEALDTSDDETDRLQTALSIYRSVKSIEEKIQVAQHNNEPFEDIDFSTDEISSYQNARSLGKALTVIAGKLELVEQASADLQSLDYTDGELEDLRTGLEVLKTRKPSLAIEQEEEYMDIQDIDLSEEDLAALRQMLGVFRAVRGLVIGISKVFQDEVA